MYLQLAEKQKSSLMPYVGVPYNGEIVWIREDKLDVLPEQQFQQMMYEIAPYEANEMGLSENDPQYLTCLQERNMRRTERRSNEMLLSAGFGAKLKNFASNVAALPGQIIGGITQPIFGGASQVLDTKGGAAAGGALASLIPGAGAAAGIGGLFGGGGGAAPSQSQINNAPPKEQSFFEEYKTPLIIGGVGIGLAGLYFATKKGGK